MNDYPKLSVLVSDMSKMSCARIIGLEFALFLDPQLVEPRVGSGKVAIREDVHTARVLFEVRLWLAAKIQETLEFCLDYDCSTSTKSMDSKWRFPRLTIQHAVLHHVAAWP